MEQAEYRIIDKQTGEVKDLQPVNKMRNNTNETHAVVVEVAPGEQLTKRKHTPMPAKTREEFVMFYTNQVQKLFLDTVNPLSINERAFLFSIIPFLEYDGRITVPDPNGQPSPLNVTKVGELMGWKHRETIGTVLKALEEKGIIKLVGMRPKFVRVNPRFFFRGRADKRTKAVEEFYKLSDKDTAVEKKKPSRKKPVQKDKEFPAKSSVSIADSIPLSDDVEAFEVDFSQYYDADELADLDFTQERSQCDYDDSEVVPIDEYSDKDIEALIA